MQHGRRHGRSKAPGARSSQRLVWRHLRSQSARNRQTQTRSPQSRKTLEARKTKEIRLSDRTLTLDLPERQTKEALSLSKHAISHGISPNFALPVPEDEHEDGRHTDTDIQTLMLPEKLSRTAKGILERGRSFERETGVNVLHAAFGILEGSVRNSVSFL